MEQRFTGGAKQMQSRRCRGAEVKQRFRCRCRGGGAEEVKRGSRGAEMQRGRGAEVQSADVQDAETQV